MIPIAQDGPHPYEWIDKAIAIIQSSGVSYKVGPFATVLEGNYREVMEVIHAVNELLLSQGCPEWISNIQLQIRSDRDITASEKTSRFTAGDQQCD